ncbi:hypothetical protein BT69DRAFT_1289181 [Atractiella rhizophila]|nr:hypothetical protein BT69DRAFT_1289181 [Atractiella rhizophila]
MATPPPQFPPFPQFENFPPAPHVSPSPTIEEVGNLEQHYQLIHFHQAELKPTPQQTGETLVNVLKAAVAVLDTMNPNPNMGDEFWGRLEAFKADLRDDLNEVKTGIKSLRKLIVNVTQSSPVWAAARARNERQGRGPYVQLPAICPVDGFNLLAPLITDGDLHRLSVNQVDTYMKAWELGQEGDMDITEKRACIAAFIGCTTFDARG